MRARVQREVDLVPTRWAGVGFALADATRLMRGALGRCMRGAGLRGSSWRVLAYLYREDGLSQTELAQLLELTRAGVGQILDQLEAAGHIERRRDVSDARRRRVFLSARMHAEVAPLLNMVREFEDELSVAFSDDEIEALRSLLDRLRERAAIMISESADAS